MATQLIFTHPSRKIRPLKVSVKPNEITWAYGLNVQTYPTYGGEVVQILSCYIEDMTVTGNVQSYRQMEAIYAWFIDYIQIATQGKKGAGSYDTRPVSMSYPERGWKFKIYPKNLPSLKYGRDVVAPEWTMQAAVVEPDPQLKENILEDASLEAIRDSGIKLFGSVTGGIGFKPDDPFSSPDGEIKASKKLNKKQGKDVTGHDSEYGKIADWYNNLIPSYLGNDFSELAADYSRPAGLGKDAGDPQKQGNQHPKKANG